MASIGTLSNELLQLIIDDLARTGWPMEPLLNAALVSRRWHDLAYPRIFQSITILLSQKGTRYGKSMLQFLLSSEGERYAIFPVKYDHIH